VIEPVPGAGRAALREIVEGAALVEYPGAAGDRAAAAAGALHRALKARPVRGVLDVIPGARTLLLLYDPAMLTLEGVARAAWGARRAAPVARGRRAVRIPVCYGGAAGPDLPSVAAHGGLSEMEVVRRHAGGSYTVGFIGFAPGFPYLRGLPAELAAPRLASPRTRVPAGSVGIGASYTGIYPSETPGGWRLIGRAPVRLFDPQASRPALLEPGDEVAFERIDEEELVRRLAALPPPRPPPLIGRPLFRLATPGLWTSVQGSPRYGFGSSGVPPGGAMDFAALAEGNALLGNPPAAAGLEITMLGPALETLSACRIVLSGGAGAAERDGTPLAAGAVHTMREGDRIRLGRTAGGARGYLCADGGLENTPWPMPSRRLDAGDRLHRAPNGPGASPPALVPAPDDGAPLRVVLSAAVDRFRPEAVETLLSRPYRVSPASDRRGIRLEGDPLAHRAGAEVEPEGTALGSIQVPPDGLPIVLGPDRPVTGGYVTIGTLLPEDWPRAARALPGSELRFAVARVARVIAEPGGGGSGR